MLFSLLKFLVASALVLVDVRAAEGKTTIPTVTRTIVRTDNLYTLFSSSFVWALLRNQTYNCGSLPLWAFFTANSLAKQEKKPLQGM